MENLFSQPMRVSMNLVGLDGDAFALMGEFQKNACRQGWEREEIKKVLNECTSGDYNHLLCVLMAHTEAV
ncbi:hypothetical protein A7P95_06770 [Eikenella longinqua]|uniref:Uncharacterized protein n=1 Tax=Eikenella longinqua TaxID=1795827 RepID=A0A1A9RXN0_9NEIS|nr:hypothetical protein [Eikenella longinqua]OAM27515.1 hypothetical protein A7P95_06770 [Eikenella longinqua]